MSNKKQLGQFFTTNYEYILQNFTIPDGIVNIIEPFAGNGDLLDFIDKQAGQYTIECFDIEPKKDFIIQRDTLLDPPNYQDKYVITNPPYIARNKSKSKEIFDKYDENDLYKCFIKILIEYGECLGGILIVPLNFWCSIRKSDVELRQRFLNRYSIVGINIFEEQVFDDTSCTICSFQFELRAAGSTHDTNTIQCVVYPTSKQITIQLDSTNNYTIGGEIYNLKQNPNYKIERATKNNQTSEFITNILVKCIDDNANSMINMSMVENDKRCIDTSPKLSARSYATLVIEPAITLEQQKKLVSQFNEFLRTKREQYNSLFLSNYRESNTIARKRISFSLVFEIVNYLLDHQNRL
jgi:hypothetical protein